MPNFRQILKGEDDSVFDRVGELFRNMYSFMETKGLSLTLVDGGEKMWLKSIKSTLGRINFLVIVEEEGEIHGFAQGMIRISPDYLGSKKGGFVSFVYIDPASQKRGWGNELVKHLESCFLARNVDFIELEVLEQNIGAVQFWEKNGYTTELFRMKKPTAPKESK